MDCFFSGHLYFVLQECILKVKPIFNMKQAYTRNIMFDLLADIFYIKINNRL
jgi:hypothetical protein